MTDAVDTSAATVEAIAKRLKRDIDWRPNSLCEQAAATLRALLAERDKAYARVDDALDAYAEECRRHGVTRQERDAALAEAARLREALEELADLMDDVVAGTYRPDSFTTQPARAALAKDQATREGGG